jgi:subtilase family serine protease
MFATILVASLLTVSPLSLAATTSSDANSTVYYNPLNSYTQLPDGFTPDAVPYCSSITLTQLVCYSPDFIRAAYDIPTTLTGTGMTIVIVDAFGSPTIASDLESFDTEFSIPAPPSFTIICGTGGCPDTSTASARIHDPVGWFIETSLDVEYAHAIAPGAKIVLEVASTNAGDAINLAEANAIENFPNSIMSQSFGVPEFAIHANNVQIKQAEANYQAATAAGITLLASAGDSGATNGLPGTANAAFPSSDPFNTAVGGTMGNPYFDNTVACVPGATCAAGTFSCSAGATCTSGLVTFNGGTLGCLTGPRPGFPTFCTPTGYGAEQVWNEGAPIDAATGGAPSLLFGVPSYQFGLGLTSRTTPDVSYNAAVNGGVLVFTSFLGFPHWFIVGGTSAGSPQWAGIIALIDQARGGPIGFLNPVLYGLAGSGFHDITVGNNQLVGTTVGFSATAGWDDASGWGTPDVAALVAALS